MTHIMSDIYAYKNDNEYDKKRDIIVPVPLPSFSKRARVLFFSSLNCVPFSYGY